MADITTKNENELMTELNQKKLSLHTLRFTGSGSKNRNVKEVKEVRRDIARLKTELSARKTKTA